MSKKEIKLALMYRDMWQSSGKYMPRVDQLIRVAPAIIDMGCFDRVETNGGGFEQINLIYGENPNRSVRQWTQAFNDAGIQTQMLERGLNGLRMSPVGPDLRELMFSLKKKQGTDIARSFDGLNNPENLKLSFEYADKGGMISQAALCISHSPLHTIDYYVNLADEFIDLGAHELCIKDMAGIGRPVTIGKIIRKIKKRHKKVVIQYHGHTTPGFSVASSLEAARNGADYIDVGTDPLSWGTGHADLITIHAMLKDAGFLLKEIDMDAYMEVRRLTQEFIDDFLGLYINPKNRFMNSLLIGSGLPGGMMGSLMSDLETSLKNVNNWLEKRNSPPISEDEFLLKLFNEVQFIWPKLGYPPLVTPFSQYVKNTALMNITLLIKGKRRWSMLDENTWGMILGESGRLIGPVAEELKALATSQNREFFIGNPQDLFPNELEKFRTEMLAREWQTGVDEEELFEFAMHPNQYIDYKEGKAKKDFENELKLKLESKSDSKHGNISETLPEQLKLSFNNKSYEVDIEWSDHESIGTEGQSKSPSEESTPINGLIVTAPLEGKFYLTKDNSETPKKIGDHINKGETIAYIESMKVINAITSDVQGTITEIVPQHGQDVEEDELLFKLN